MELQRFDEITKICSALSNKKRLIILYEFITKGDLSLNELHENTSRKTGFDHRETTFNYLKKLIEAGIIGRKSDKEGVVYSLQINEIRIQFDQFKLD